MLHDCAKGDQERVEKLKSKRNENFAGTLLSWQPAQSDSDENIQRVYSVIDAILRAVCGTAVLLYGTKFSMSSL